MEKLKISVKTKIGDEEFHYTPEVSDQILFKDLDNAAINNLSQTIADEIKSLLEDVLAEGRLKARRSPK